MKNKKADTGPCLVPTADRPVIESGVRKTSDDGGAGRI